MRRKAAPAGSHLQTPVVVVLFLVLLASGCAAGPPGRTPVSPTATAPLLPTPVPPRVGGADLAVAYVFDASAAMQAPFGNVTRLAAARRLLAEHLWTQPMDARLGLWAFGHRRHLTERAASCADVEQVAPLLPGQGARIASWLETVQAQGLAPLTAALESALIDLRSAPVARKGLVLISGGADSCGRDPCAAVQALTATGARIELHVIALGVDPVAAGQLRCIADAVGGRVHQVANEGEMAQALEEIAAALQPVPTAPVEIMPAPQTAPPDTSPAPHGPTAEAVITATHPPPTVTLAATLPARRGVTTATRPAALTPVPSASPSAAVLPPPPAETSPPQPEATPYVEALQAVNVRAGPGLIYPVIGRVAVGTRLTPLASFMNQAEDRLWLLVCCLPDRRPGWVAAELVTKAPLDLPTPATVPPSPTPSPTLRATATPLPQPTAPPPAPPPMPSPEPPGKLPVPTPVP